MTTLTKRKEIDHLCRQKYAQYAEPCLLFVRIRIGSLKVALHIQLVGRHDDAIATSVS